jgi:hypothetical protein
VVQVNSFLYGIFPNTTLGVANQVSRINAHQALERVVIDLVGEVAGYTPGGKVLIVEGEGYTEFDRTMLTALFPKFAEKVTIISGGSKRNVDTLQELLKKAGGGGNQFFSVRDSDAGSYPQADAAANVASTAYAFKIIRQSAAYRRFGRGRGGRFGGWRGRRRRQERGCELRHSRCRKFMVWRDRAAQPLDVGDGVPVAVPQS